MIPPFAASGLLPVGRFRATPAEVQQRYVDHPDLSASSTRTTAWNDFTALVDLIRRQRVRVPAAFLGGSFVSDKVDPGDIDTSLLIDASRITSAHTWAKVTNLVANTKSAGLNLDAFLIPWFPEPDQASIPPVYLAERGKWDDWWQRYVDKADRASPVRSHALPACGYLEVILDDYS